MNDGPLDAVRAQHGGTVLVGPFAPGALPEHTYGPQEAAGLGGLGHAEYVGDGVIEGVDDVDRKRVLTGQSAPTSKR